MYAHRAGVARAAVYQQPSPGEIQQEPQHRVIPPLRAAMPRRPSLTRRSAAKASSRLVRPPPVTLRVNTYRYASPSASRCGHHADMFSLAYVNATTGLRRRSRGTLPCAAGTARSHNLRGGGGKNKKGTGIADVRDDMRYDCLVMPRLGVGGRRYCGGQNNGIQLHREEGKPPTKPTNT